MDGVLGFIFVSLWGFVLFFIIFIVVRWGIEIRSRFCR